MINELKHNKPGLTQETSFEKIHNEVRLKILDDREK